MVLAMSCDLCFARAYFLLYRVHCFFTGKPVPNNVSSKSLVRSAKKEARQAEKKDEDKPLAKVTVTVYRGDAQCLCVCVVMPAFVDASFQPSVTVHP